MALDIFLSHTAKDSNLAAAIASVFEDAGVTVWWEGKVRGDSDQEGERRQALDEARALAVLLTPESDESEFLQDEWRPFLHDPRRLIALLAAGASADSLPSTLRGYGAVDLLDMEAMETLRYMVYDLRMSEPRPVGDSEPNSDDQVAQDKGHASRATPLSEEQIFVRNDDGMGSGLTGAAPGGTRALSVFICHSSGDKEAARRLVKSLTKAGISPWLDEEKILPGQNWDHEIRRAIRESDVVVVCLSRSSVTKRGYVQRELSMALDIALEQPPNSIFLIPVRLEECDVPESLQSRQWVDLFKRGGFQRLQKALKYCAARLGEA